MSDTLSRAEPVPAPRPDTRIETAPVSRPELVSSTGTPLHDRVPAPTPAVPSPAVPDAMPAATPETGLDQLSRIEDKTARIEEKYARSEARMQRVVDKVDSAMDRFSNVALQSDLSAVRGEVGLINRRLKKLPGFPALLLTSVLTAILTAAVIVLLYRYGGTFLTPVR
jgi:hypothetical protein